LSRCSDPAPSAGATHKFGASRARCQTPLPRRPSRSGDRAAAEAAREGG
jgi:hypothetical protein